MTWNANLRVKNGFSVSFDDLTKLAENCDHINDMTHGLTGSLVMPASGGSYYSLAAGGAIVSWSSGPAALWSAGSPTRITIPTDYAWFRCQASLSLYASTAFPNVQTNMDKSYINILKNGASNYVGAPLYFVRNQNFINVYGPWIPVSAADYFEMSAGGETGSASGAFVRWKVWVTK